MILCGVDFETTGFDPISDNIIEIGAVLWETELNGPVALASTFLQYRELRLSDEIKRVTGIDDWMLEKYGVKPGMAMDELQNFLQIADVVVAHNGIRFDKPFYESFCRKLGSKPVERPWIDTQTDIPFHSRIQTRKLNYLAAEHGFVNPFPHRAVFDVLTMLRVLSFYPIDPIVALAKEPMVLVQALVSYNERDLAKLRGYYWDAASKSWLKMMRHSQFVTEQSEAGFKVREVPQ